MNQKTFLTITALVAFVIVGGCAPKKKLQMEPAIDPTAQESTDQSETAAGKEDIVITQDWTEIPALKNALFVYDSAQLDETARAVIKKNVAVIKKLPASVTVRVEGHCDDRGTVEYNIALGQRRANAIRSYYATAGVTKNRLETISFGEERPVCQEQTDNCWAMNRRGATRVKNSEPVTIKPAALE